MVEENLKETGKEQNNEKPFVSIVILTKNAGTEFKQTLDLVFQQKVPFKFEVIIVDSCSIDDTLKICREYSTTIYSIKPEEFNFGSTRDFGFSLAKGEIVVAISQDIFPSGNDWLLNLIAPFEDPTIAVVQGIDIPPQKDGVFYWDKIGLLYFTREMRNWIRDHGGIGLSFTSCAIRKWVWEENKLGSVEMAEDKVFQKKVWERGHKIFFQRKARHNHTHYQTVTKFIKRCKNEGMGMRNVGQVYSSLDMVADLHDKKVLRAWLDGIKQSKIHSTAEFLFPIIRPLFIFYGNHFTKKYIR